MLAITLGIYYPIFQTGNLALRVGTSVDLAFYTASIISGASILGRLGVPLLADRVGVRSMVRALLTAQAIEITSPSTALAGVCCLCVIAVQHSNTAGVVVFDVAYGILSGSYVAVLPAMVAQITAADEMTKLGNRSGLMFLVAAPGALAVGPITGRLIVRSLVRHSLTLQAAGNGSYTGAAIYAGVVVLFGSALLLAASVVFRRRARRRPVAA